MSAMAGNRNREDTGVSPDHVTQLRRRWLLRMQRWRRAGALLVGSMGVANIASSLVVRVASREAILRDLLPLEVAHGSRHAAVMAGLALLAVSRGLWRGKRASWLIAVALLVGSAALHLLKGMDWEEASVALLLTGLLIRQRAAFRAPPDRATVRRALLAIGWGVLILIFYSGFGLALLGAQFRQPWGWRDALMEILARLTLNTGPLMPQTHRALWLLESWSIWGVTLASYAIVALLRPFVAAPASASEREQARALVNRYGASSLAPFALMPDKSLYFGRSVAGLIAYRVAGDVAVVCGDPLVASEDLAALIDEFVSHCARHGWNVCLYEASDSHLAIYDSAGLRALKIGEDAWIDLQRFTLKGKPIADIRHAVAKIERDGLVFQILDPALPEEHASWWTQMQTIAAAQSRGDWELQFSIGRLPAMPDPEARYALAIGPDGAVQGFCSWLPIPAIRGWALDVMQRAPGAPNGTMEHVIAQSLLYFQRDGAAWASLGVAPLADARVNHDDERSLLQRGVRLLYEHPKLNELYRYKSLFFFKRKFAPQWRSVYLIYDSRLALPRVLYAVLKVHLPLLGPPMISDFLATQGERQIARWRDWLQLQRRVDAGRTPAPE